MNISRVKEIFESQGTFPVHLEGESVWIESVDEANRMATVQVGATPQNTKTVSVEWLQEGKPEEHVKH